MSTFSSFLSEATRKYLEDEMSVYAAQASFFIILAAFPFFMLMLSLIELIPIIHESDLLSVLVDVMPDNLDALVISVLDSLRSKSPGAIFSITAIAAMWSASKGMLGIERGLNRAYNVNVERNYLVRRLLCTCYTFLFTIMCALSLVFRFSALLILLILFLAFYVVLPHKKQKISSQLPGAIFSAFGWILFSTAFSVYFRYFGRFTITYGSLTAAVLMMLWLYFCLCILFLGAEINCILNHKH